MEHRCGHRVVMDLPVRLRLMPSTIGWGCLLNISATGAFVRTRLRLPPLSLVYVEPPLNARDAWPLDREPMAACVVWWDNAGAGLEWCKPFDELLEFARLDPNSSVTDWR